jgi:hypothetical protein
VDLRREHDIEQLRRVALAQQVQIEQLLRVLRAKLAAIKGNEKELQQTLALIEELSRAASPSPTPTEATATPDSTTPAKDREHFGHTEQTTLPSVEQLFELDAADMMCPSCGGDLHPMKGQFETSEMVDVVEVSYRVVQVKQKSTRANAEAASRPPPVPSARRRAAVTRSTSPSRSPSTSISITFRWIDNGASCAATAWSSPRRPSGTNSRCSVEGSKRRLARCSLACSHNPSSASIRQAGSDSTAKLTSLGRCGV